jgi:hypothetical protein
VKVNIFPLQINPTFSRIGIGFALAICDFIGKQKIRTGECYFELTPSCVLLAHFSLLFFS